MPDTPLTLSVCQIMGKSNTAGGGRGSSEGTIVGDVINHGKREFWKSGTTYHYHQGMAAGDNTLEVTLSRLSTPLETEYSSVTVLTSLRRVY